MPEQPPEYTPSAQELDTAIQLFGKPMQPEKKRELMTHLRGEKRRFITKEKIIARMRSQGRDRSR